MHRRTGFVLLLLAIAILLPERATGQKKEEKSTARGTLQEYKQLIKQGQATGKLSSVDPKGLILAIEQQYLEPRNAADFPENLPATSSTSQAYQLWKQQQAVLRATNPVQRQIAMERLLMSARRYYTGPNAPFRLVKSAKEYEMVYAEKLVIRRMTIPPEYDDKGFLKTYTKEQLAKLRGNNPKIPGYAAKPDDVQVGQKVTVHLAPAKEVKKDEANKEEGVGNIERPQIRMLVILEEAKAPMTGVRVLPRKD
jgi:hypothetical protein